MNILFITHSPVDPFAGGVQRITSSLASSLTEFGHMVFFVSVSRRKGNNSIYLPNSKSINSEENVCFVQDYIRSNHVDVVVNQCGIDKRVFALIRKLKGVNVISCCHNSLLGAADNFWVIHRSFVERYPFLRFFSRSRLVNQVIKIAYVFSHRLYYRNICKYSSFVILLTNSMREEFEQIVGHGFHTDKVRIIPNFINLPDNVRPIKGRRNELLYVGRIDRAYKRTDLLIDIWVEFCKLNSLYSLKIIGDGADLEYVRRKAQKANCQRIGFEGKCDPEPYYNESKALLLTSCSESFGLVLIEGMSHGLVPFAFDSFPAVREVIDNEHNGILIEPNNVQAYAMTLNRVLQDAEMYNKLSDQALQDSRAYGRDNVVKKWLEILNVLS